MATKRLKEQHTTEGDLEPKSMAEDRISDLPDSIIIHILSFLPTIVAIRMSLLSKRWRRMWNLIKVLNFSVSRDVEFFRRPNNQKNNERKKFFNFVDRCLNRPYADTSIEKFTLEVEYYGGRHRMDRWMRFPLKKNVRELVLHIKRARALYCLPSALLSLRSLTLLKLNGLELTTGSGSPIVNLPCLKELCLFNVVMNDQVLNNLLLGCPCLEKLHVHYCCGLLNPQVLSLSLESLEYYECNRYFIQTLTVEARNLQSFEYKGVSVRKDSCNVNLFHCVAIKHLSFSDVCMTGRWFEDLIPRLNSLESLKIDSCYGVKHINVRNQHLKELDFDCRLNRTELTTEIIIETPCLESLTYSGCLTFRISVSASNLLYADINVCGQLDKTAYDMEWYTSLIKFLSEFNGTKNIRIFCGSEKALIIPNELRDIHPSPLSDVKYLKVKTALPLFRKEMFRKSMHWISPSLETLTIE
uniref:F-box domain-containing protein n=1 Tax=Cannabis sativa TaxID=3483 RepID=A0A803RAT7_CANSA